MENYRYLRLPTQRSFRLLKITNDGSPIEISVRTFEMGSSPKYTALSYTWGPPVEDKDIDTGAKKIHHPFPYPQLPGKLNVTPNLHDALLQLQRSRHSEYLWIDAICIDHSTTEEKNHQVNMMCDVYEQASSVLVWLGKEDESLPVVRGLLDRLSAYAHRAHDLPNKTDDARFELAKVAAGRPMEADLANENRGIPNFNDEERQVLSAFFGRRWFSRIWVVQEVALAKKVDILWGSTKLPWATMAHFIDDWHVANTFKAAWWTPNEAAKREGDGTMRRASFIREISKFVSGRPTYRSQPEPVDDGLQDEQRDERTAQIFTEVVHATRWHCSEDPRDKVFGLLGVMQKATRLLNLPDCPIKADYSKPVAQVYQEATSYILHNVGDLLPLSMVSDRSLVQRQDLASWIIDFSVPGSDSVGMLNASQQGWPNFNVWTGRRDFTSKNKVTNNTMLLYVHILDEVSSTGEAASEVFSSNLEPYMSFILDCPQIYNNGQNRVEALWRTLIWDLTVERFSADGRFHHPAPAKCAASFRSWLAISIGMEIRETVRRGDTKKRSECFREMPNLVKVALNDPTGTIPRIFELRTICEDNGVLEDRLDPGPNPAPFGTRNREGSILNDADQAAFRSALRQPFNSDRRIYRTRRGHLGSGPFSTKQGDVVVLVTGKRVPVILRPLGSPHEPKYQLLGDTYVHGIMHGEAMTPDLKLKWVAIV